MNSVAANETFGIVVHGGAGVMQNLSNEKQNQIKVRLKRVLMQDIKSWKMGLKH